MFGQVRAKLLQRVNFRRVAGLYRRRLSKRIYAQLGGIIAHGPFTGMTWPDLPGWGRSDQGVIVLGLYEQEVAHHLMTAPARYQVFVDVGAADGYYAVGLLFTNRVRRSIAFEMLPEARAAMRDLAVRNEVDDRLIIFGAAEADLIDRLRESGAIGDETMFLIDIEGAEFRLLTEGFFQTFSKSLIVVELHPHIFPDPQREIAGLLERALGTHTSTVWFSGARNPWELRELDEGYSELDRWMLCSEGRMEPQSWVRFDPLTGSV